MKTVLKSLTATALAAVMLITCAAVGAAEEEEMFRFRGKTEASIVKKTVPYITDFGEQYGGRKESETNICFVDGGELMLCGSSFNSAR